MAEAEVEGGAPRLRREAAAPLQARLASGAAREAERLGRHRALTVPARRRGQGREKSTFVKISFIYIHRYIYI